MEESQPLTSLVPRLSQGDEDALCLLVDRALPRLRSIAMRVGASFEDGEEVAMDAIFNTLLRLGQLSFDAATGKDPLFSYMAEAARKGAFGRRRKQRRDQAALSEVALSLPPQNSPDDGDSLDNLDFEPDGAASTPFTAAAAPGQQTKLKALWREFEAQLSEEDKLILALSAEGVLNSREIGSELGLTDATVRQRYKRIADRFRKHVDNQETADAGA